MGQVKSYYHDELEVGPADRQDSQYDIDAEEDLIYERLLDEINALIREEAELDIKDNEFY
jgi:hypothetical protein